MRVFGEKVKINSLCCGEVRCCGIERVQQAARDKGAGRKGLTMHIATHMALHTYISIYIHIYRVKQNE